MTDAHDRAAITIGLILAGISGAVIAWVLCWAAKVCV